MMRKKIKIKILALAVFAATIFPVFSYGETVLFYQPSERQEPEQYIVSYDSNEIEVVEFFDEEEAEKQIEELKEDPAVSYIEPDYERYLMSDSSEPLYAQQWALERLEAPGAWEMAGTLERDVVVAVIDSGVTVSHPDLLNRIVPGGISIINGQYGDQVTGVYNHGTLVSGIIAAETGNGAGIAGAAGPLGVKILPINIFGGNAKANTSDLIMAIDYAISRNVDVINLSLGGVNSSAAENEAVQRALAAGIVVVAACGNLQTGITDPDPGTEQPLLYPASYEGVISVGSIDANNTRSSFSYYNSKVSVVAPGRDILSTDMNGGYTAGHNGTSFAAPFVSAIAAIYKGEHPESTPGQIRKRMEDTAIDLGIPGRDNLYGYGRVNFTDILRTDPSADGSSGIIDAVVVEKDGQKIVAPMDGTGGYAYALSARNQLYEHLKTSGGGIILYAVRSGTKYMLLSGNDGYTANYSCYATPLAAMLATPAVPQSEYGTFYLFGGFGEGGEAILSPIEP